MIGGRFVVSRGVSQCITDFYLSMSSGRKKNLEKKFELKSRELVNAL